MVKKRSKNLNNLKINKHLALRILPVVAAIASALGGVAFLFHNNGQKGSSQISNSAPKPAAKLQPNTAATQSDQSASTPKTAPWSATTSTIAPTQPQDTCDEQAAEDAKSKAKVASDNVVNLYKQWVANDTEYHSQGGTTDSQYQQNLDHDRFTEELDLQDIDQSLVNQLTQLGCPIVHAYSL